jgi:PAS domain S-box-containing protein
MTTLQAFREQAAAWTPHIALMDLNLPDGRATDVLPDPEDTRTFPIVVMTSYGSEQTAVEAMKCGAWDYLVKLPETFRDLPRTLQRVLKEWQRRTEGKRLHQELVRSQEELKAVYDHAPVLMCVVDANRRVLYANPAFRAHTGASETDLKGGQAGGALGCLNAVEELGGCGFGAGCRTCPLRLAIDDTLRTGVGHTNVEFSTTLVQNGKQRIFSLLGSTARIPTGDHHGILLCLNDISDHKQAELALQQSELRYRTQFDLASDGIFTLSREGKLLEVNEAFAHMHGYTREELQNINLEDLDTPKSHEAVPERMRRILAGETLSFEVEHFHKEGHTFPIEVSANLIASDSGPAILCFHRDITKRKESEAALRESEERYRTLFEQMTEGFALEEVVCDEEGKPSDLRFIDMNPAFEAQTGLKNTEVAGRTLRELFPDVEPLWIERYGKVALTGEPVQFEAEFGALRRIYGVRAFRTVPGRLGVMFTDISDRKQAEAQLQASKDLLSKALSVSPDAFAITSLEDGIYAEVNEGFTRITGYTKDELIGRSSVAASAPLWADPKDRDRLVEGLKEKGEVVDLEANFLGKGGQLFIGLMSAKLFEVDGEKKVLSVTRDITARKQAEEETLKLQAQLQQSQKMESLGVLAGGVAHDMNNVLGAILGLASAHIGTQPYGSPLHQALDTICKATERGGKMVKSLLNFARQSPVENHELDMNAILKEQVGLLERTTLAKVRLQMDLETGLRPIRGDASALTHAFMNLCVNALDAMPEEGTLTLHTRNVDHDWIEVVVEDTGTGMPKEVLDKALDPFFTTKGVGKGTGLGLSMVFSTVKAHRGQMAIQSAPGQGTRVMLRFPACENGVQDPEPALSETAPPTLGTLRVLLVDDDELVQSSVQALLEVLGHTAVTTAQCGEEALAKLEAGLEADLIILDMNMPGLGGAGTLPRLRTLRPTVPVLLSTGRADQVASSLASAHPGVTLLSKPFGLRELQKHIEALGLG